MSVNKKALTRYLAYDKLFRNRGRKYIWKDLLEAANEALLEEGLQGIGKTQLYADIQYMQCSEWKAPIETETDPSDKRIKYYYYSDAGYSISNQPLSETEMTYLKSAVTVLSRFKGMPQFEWVNEIIPAIESKLGLIKLEKEVISFDSNIDYEGLVFITPLFNAIVNKRMLRITYQDFRSPVPYEIEFHPYYLKQYNNRWFVLGLNPERSDKIQNLALDRIKEIQESTGEYLTSDIVWEEYFSDFVGVSKNDTAPIEIRILILDEEQASYIRTKPLHETQKPLRKVEGGFETSIKVIPNYELEKLILSFGERIMVVSPKDFQEKIAERMRKSALLYKGI
jgi:predicted DNA-binding transcriptional regulator YafY